VTVTQEQLTREAQYGADSAGPPRSAAVGRRGMVGSAHPLVTQVALDVMRRGGNAIDAAVAAGAMLMLVEPRNGHLGGDAFVQVTLPDEGQRVVAINGSGAAPHKATLERFQSLGEIPADGPWASTVPGVVSAWAVLLERFGTRPLAELLEPAIDYAEHGIAVNARQHNAETLNAELYRRYPETEAIFTPGGVAPAEGALVRQPLLARSLRRIAEGGPDEFYTGSLAADMVRASQAQGGPFAPQDFAEHRTEVLDPVQTSFLGYTVYEQPPVSQGLIVLLALNILEAVDLPSVPPGSLDAFHLQIEAIKLAVEDRQRLLGDPQWVDVPLDWMLSKEHAREQAARVDPRHARVSQQPRQILPDTTAMMLADERGMMVAYIHSLFSSSGVVLGDTGVLMNNRLRGFSLEPGHPNVLAPGKRPIHTLNTYVVKRDDEPLLIGGTPGAHWQVQANIQLLSNVLAWGMDLQTAQERPRWLMGESSHANNTRIRVETRAGEAVIDGLAELGHDVEVMGPWAAGNAEQLIGRDPSSGVYTGATEPRRLGCTVLGF
jgi:gamma-glutamyltranspeptidase/glutathione hydrolase